MSTEVIKRTSARTSCYSKKKKVQTLSLGRYTLSKGKPLHLIYTSRIHFSSLKVHISSSSVHISTHMVHNSFFRNGAVPVIAFVPFFLSVWQRVPMETVVYTNGRETIRETFSIC